MGLLSEEDHGTLSAFLSGDLPDEEETPEVSPDESSDPAEDVQANADEGDSADLAPAEDSPAEDEDDAPGHRVPYNRFKQVLDARNEFRDDIALLQEELEGLRSAPAHTAPAPAPPQIASEKSDDEDLAWLKEILKEDSSVDSQVVDKIRAEFSGMNERIYNQEVEVAGQRLEIEIDDALTSYPSVPREVIYQAVASDPGVTALNVAEHYASVVGGIEEAAIAQYLVDNPQEPAAAPHVESAGSTEYAEAPDTKLLTIDEGSSALRKFLSNTQF